MAADRGCGQGPGAASLGDLDAGGAGGPTGDATVRSAARFFGNLAVAAAVPARAPLFCLRQRPAPARPGLPVTAAAAARVGAWSRTAA